MKLLGLALSGSGLSFISAKAIHKPNDNDSSGIVVCETQEQCDAISAWAMREHWNITTRLATTEEIADAKYWNDRL